MNTPFAPKKSDTQSDLISMVKLLSDEQAFSERLNKFESARTFYESIQAELIKLQHQKSELENFIAIESAAIAAERKQLAAEQRQLKIAQEKLVLDQGNVASRKTQLESKIATFTEWLNPLKQAF